SRFHHVRDVAFALQEAVTNTPPTPRETRSSRRLGLTAIAIVIAIVVAVLLFRPSTAEREQVWTGTVLGGPTIAYSPHPAPDGSKVAFQAVVNGQSQLALMEPKSGDWTVLTHDRDGGSIMHLSWSQDGTRIFFDRIGAVNRVFSIPAVGGEPRLILENASGPGVLPNGDMIIGGVNENGAFQLHLLKPNTMEVKPLSALPNFFISTYPALPSGSGVAFFEKPADSPNAAKHLYILDL